MKKKSGFLFSILNILFWSVVSAAFIGPGTVTTAAKAGSLYQLDLIWCLVFATLACLVLQEASARLTMLSGMNLGQAIHHYFEGKKWHQPILWLVVGAIILGSAAYQTGNLLGAVAGIGLISQWSPAVWTWLVGIGVALVLSVKQLGTIATFLGVIVMVMGIAFLFTATLLQPSSEAILKAVTFPRWPEGASLYVLGLVGTTVVPYNLFLGSGLAGQKQRLSEMRLGLSVAVILGGVISMAVLVVGSHVEGAFSYELLAGVLEARLGKFAPYMFAIGMFVAGFSSAITAPLASALTAQSLFGHQHPSRWEADGGYFRLVWLGVLLVGMFCGLVGLKPIPAIILAQALNGLVLPLISIFLVYLVNDQRLLGAKGINQTPANLLMGLIVWITLMLGLANLLKALNAAWGAELLKVDQNMEIVAVFAASISILLWIDVYRRRKRRAENT